jgi:hypothetical protein
MCLKMVHVSGSPRFLPHVFGLLPVGRQQMLSGMETPDPFRELFRRQPEEKMKWISLKTAAKHVWPGEAR